MKFLSYSIFIFFTVFTTTALFAADLTRYVDPFVGTGKTGNPTAADVQPYFEAKGLHRR